MNRYVKNILFFLLVLIYPASVVRAMNGTTNAMVEVSAISKDEFVCDECGQEFKSGLSLANHKRIHPKSNGKNVIKWRCTHCLTKKLTGKLSLIQHKYSKHLSRSPSPFSCRKQGCSKLYGYLRHRNNHENVCTSQSSLIDKLQDSTSPAHIEAREYNKASYQKKLKSDHSDALDNFSNKVLKGRKVPPKKYQCDKCAYTFSYKAAFEIHKKTHFNSETPFSNVLSNDLPSRNFDANSLMAAPSSSSSSSDAQKSLMQKEPQDVQLLPESSGHEMMDIDQGVFLPQADEGIVPLTGFGQLVPLIGELTQSEQILDDEIPEFMRDSDPVLKQPLASESLQLVSQPMQENEGTLSHEVESSSLCVAGRKHQRDEDEATLKTEHPAKKAKGGGADA